MTEKTGKTPPPAPEPLAKRRARQAQEGRMAMGEHLAMNRAIDERTARLRALRLAKEAAERASEARKPASKAPRSRKPRAK